VKLLLALVLTQAAAAVVAAHVAEGMAQTDVQIALSVPLAALWIWCAVKASRSVGKPAPIASPVAAAETPDPRAEYHRDCVAWAEGSLSWEDFLRRWAGRVPPGRRASERRAREQEEREIALFKEVMSPAFADPPMPPRFRRGQWVRALPAGAVWPGALMRVKRAKWFPGPTWSYELETVDTIRDLHEAVLVPATPLPGEWWEWIDCPSHLRVPDAGKTGPQCVPPLTDPSRDCDLEAEASWCGCLRPVNYGRGRDL
jgi:hypothetical protein